MSSDHQFHYQWRSVKWLLSLPPGVWAALAAILLIWLAPALAVRGQSAGPNQAGLVVVHGDGQVTKRCVAFAESEINGLELLYRSGLDLNYDSSGMGGAICRLDNEGCSTPEQPCFCQCQGSPCLYWSYWRQDANATWQYSNRGAAITTVKPGEVDGWVWGVGSVDGAITPPAIAFADVCQQPTPTASPAPTIPPSETPTIAPSATPTASATATASAMPSATATPLPTGPFTAVPTPVPTATSTFMPAATPVPAPVASLSTLPAQPAMPVIVQPTPTAIVVPAVTAVSAITVIPAPPAVVALPPAPPAPPSPLATPLSPTPTQRPLSLIVTVATPTLTPVPPTLAPIVLPAHLPPNALAAAPDKSKAVTLAASHTQLNLLLLLGGGFLLALPLGFGGLLVVLWMAFHEPR